MRGTLEAIAYGTDERISPGDRIRAIERLAELPPPRREASEGLSAGAGS